MQNIQLYIEGQRVDMFSDESVTITQSIKNVKDIGKVFTDFTRTFSVPASKDNNKIFKHYYNFDINNGFDARTKKPSTIELNSLPFRNGKIKLEGVNLKDNKPHTYRITFFGSTVELKDLIGDDTLSDLSVGLSPNDTIYNPANIQSGLSLSPTTNDLIVPLITHTKRLYYDSSSGHVHSIEGASNVFYDSSSGHDYGVKWDDLKFALRLDVIIKAIETQYDITFSTDFFVDTNAPYYELFMWLHRKKGAVESPSGFNQSRVNGWSDYQDTNTQTSMLSSSFSIGGLTARYSDYSLTLTTASSTSYIVSIQNGGLEVYNSGSVSNTLVISSSDFTLQQGNYTVFISSDADITFSNVTWYVRYNDIPSGYFTKTYSTGTYNHINSFDFNITQQIPEMKVIDLLTSVFKTFNLTAFIDKNTNEIVVKTLDSFYASGISYDVTKYIDVNKSSVDIALPYRKINFEYEDTDTLLAKQHEQLFGKAWGKTEYTNGEKLDGGIYDVKTVFSHLKYERLINVNGLTDTDIQFGFFVDDNQESYYGLPLLFYPIKQTSATPISFLTTDTSHISLTSYNVPSNSVSLSSSVSKANINFYAETNEFQRVAPNDFTDTLFEVYYKNYITSVFNPKNRISKVTAYLPLRILLNYTLADRFVINGNSYKINSIKTNLKSGKSELELLNDL